jgi:AcrB/AcrD/AcrF family
VFGILPLAVATGAGSNSRNSLGTAVLGGMVISTALNLVFVPVLYVIISGLRDRFQPRRRAAVVDPSQHHIVSEVVGWVTVENNGEGEWRPVYEERPEGHSQN